MPYRMIEADGLRFAAVASLPSQLSSVAAGFADHAPPNPWRLGATGRFSSLVEIRPTDQPIKFPLRSAATICLFWKQNQQKSCKYETKLRCGSMTLPRG